MEMLNVSRAFTFGFEDEQWIVKLLVGALLLLVSLVFSIVLVGILPALVLSGYSVAIARNVGRGEELPLPQWEALTGMLADGFRLAVAYFVWGLPILVLLLPGLLLSAAAGDNNALATVAALVLAVCGCLAFIYGIFLALLSPIIMWQIADEERLGAAFDFSRILSILRANLGQVIILVVVLLAAQLVAALVGLLLCGVGVLVTSIWGLWVEGHLVGQLGRLAGSREVAAPLTPEPVG